MRSSRIIEKAIGMGLRIPQPNNAFEQEHYSFLFIPLRVCLEVVELDYGCLAVAAERTIY